MSEIKCNVEACIEPFKNIDEKLNVIHADMKDLTETVQNGLSNRLNTVENDLSVLEIENARRERTSMRLQTAFLSLVVALSTGATYYVVRHFSSHQPPSIIQKA